MIASTTDIVSQLAIDKRCKALACGLLQLSRQELDRLYDVLLATPDQIVVDTVNYDVDTDGWCPLAVGLGVPEIARRRGGINSNADAKKLILDIGCMKHGEFSLNPISGIAGDFFRDDRYADLTVLVTYLLDNYTDMRQKYGYR
jgi:hypothetical protein